jgi:hypothetical protein
LVVGSTGLTPVLATISAGAGIGITNGAGTITVAVTGGGTTWTDVSGLTQAIAVNNSYTANNAGLVTLTLPAASAYGSVVEISGKGAGGWLIAQNAGNMIIFGSSSSTPGIGGSIASTGQFDTVRLVCTVVDAVWTVTSCVGNLTIV